MSRIKELRRFIAPTGKGIEIAPYFNPIVPKASGYDVLIFDVFDTDRLRENARHDPNIPDERIPEIEAVDVVSDACRLGEEIEKRGLAGKIDYIVSSHNFEHLPDPIRFLRGCETALREGGVLSMAIPDYRACFDHFRTPTRLADWLTAHSEKRSQPSPATLFDAHSLYSLYDSGHGFLGSCDLATGTPECFQVKGDLKAEYAAFLARQSDPGQYQDAHCSTVFGPLMELLLLDLRHLELIGFEVVEITETRGHEFFVHLRKPTPEAIIERDDGYNARRINLLYQVNSSLGAAGFLRDNVDGWQIDAEHTAKQLVARLVGPERMERLRLWNRSRKARRKPERGE